MKHMDEDTLVQIATFAYRHEADFAASVLDAAGIDSVVRDGYFAGVDPAVMFSLGGVPLLVRARESEEARNILASVAESDDTNEE